MSALEEIDPCWKEAAESDENPARTEPVDDETLDNRPSEQTRLTPTHKRQRFPPPHGGSSASLQSTTARGSTASTTSSSAAAAAAAAAATYAHSALTVVSPAITRYGPAASHSVWSRGAHPYTPLPPPPPGRPVHHLPPHPAGSPTFPPSLPPHHRHS